MDPLVRVAYEGYGEHTHWLTFDGRPMPSWAALTPRTRDAWAAAIEAVLKAQGGETDVAPL
jgi:hypothetical protein